MAKKFLLNLKTSHVYLELSIVYVLWLLKLNVIINIKQNSVY